MKLAIALLGIALIILVGIMRTQSNNIQDLQREIRDLNEKVAERSRADEVQAKCAQQAGKAFDGLGYSKTEFTAYESHYAAKLDKCMMRVLHTDAQTARGKAVWAYVSVLDASGGKQYGAYAWHTETSKKFVIVPPVTCEVTLSTGEQKTCRSMEEFNELVKVYMEGN